MIDLILSEKNFTYLFIVLCQEIQLIIQLTLKSSGLSMCHTYHLFDRLIHSHQGFVLSSWQALLSLCMHWNAWTGVDRVSYEVMAEKPQGWGRDLGCLWAEHCQITPALSYIWYWKDHFSLTVIQNNGFSWIDKIIRLQ